VFHVYSSFWFSAIYILLFISLAGCIVPRTWQFVGVLRSQPPAAPKHLERMPVYASWQSRVNEAVALSAAQQVLKRRRFRVARNGGSVTSEKGYLREVGNLLFHISLFGLLLAFAAGRLLGGQGTVIVVEGSAFSNNVTQYDDFMPSTFYTADSLDPFGFKLDSFSASYQTSGQQVGTAREFKAHVSYWTGSDSTKTRSGTIEVNHPLEIGGSNVYLTAHGYAPVIRVTDAKGNVVFDGPTPCLPQDANLSSICAIKVSDGYVNSQGTSEQLGFSALLTPTKAPTSEFGRIGPHSIFPQALDPALYLTAYHGDLGNNSGAPQSVYQLNTKHLKQYTETGKDKNGKTVTVPMALQLAPGQGFDLPSGGTVVFTGLKQWANFTVAHNPGTGWALSSAVLAVLGLIGSLFVQRRRIWVRAVTGPDGLTTVEVAGLARSESARIAEELADVALELQRAARAEKVPKQQTAADPDPVSTASKE
jgi:cytochrome c biogenesis protein